MVRFKTVIFPKIMKNWIRLSCDRNIRSELLAKCETVIETASPSDNTWGTSFFSGPDNSLLKSNWLNLANAEQRC